ncbi:hypothetical protein [Robertkochia solimangrovi]|nr:hypothetical protein [Robertkochia solimangrovi]
MLRTLGSASTLRSDDPAPDFSGQPRRWRSVDPVYRRQAQGVFSLRL